MNRYLFALLIASILLSSNFGLANEDPVSKPLYRDTIYDGTADPVVIWNPHAKTWWMYYTNRRANVPGLSGVAWVHGTPIGIAQSTDKGRSWNYFQDARIDVSDVIEEKNLTFWAPDVYTAPDGRHFMFLTLVPGIFENWNHPRSMIQLESEDMLHWGNAREIHLASDRVIDACIFEIQPGHWRMWYNNERDHKSIYYADSADLQQWKDMGKAVGDQGGEGPKVFQWKGYYWMIVDVWDGLGVYRSDDATDWVRMPGNLLKEPGSGVDDQVIGGHPDVVVSNDHAYLFYFTHPGRTPEHEGNDGYEHRRSSIQVVELEFDAGLLSCDRNKPTYLMLETAD